MEKEIKKLNDLAFKAGYLDGVRSAVQALTAMSAQLALTTEQINDITVAMYKLSLNETAN